MKKGKNNIYCTLQLEDYLSARSILNWEQKKTALQLRTGMLKIATNFPNRFGGTNCQLGCLDTIENLEHIFTCNYGENGSKIKTIEDFEWIFKWL